MSGKGFYTNKAHYLQVFPICAKPCYEVEEGYPPRIEVFGVSEVEKGVPLYKVIKKSFVRGLIEQKNERSIIQSTMKKNIKVLPHVKGYELFQSSIDKNGYDISCLHFAIDFFYGKMKGYLSPTFDIPAINRAIKLVS